MSGFWQTIQQISNLDISGLYEFSPLAIFFILFFATFITEDGACLAAGALAGQGRISFALALGACFTGIFFGDLGLYWVGRLFGRSFTKTRLFRRFVSERRLESASNWLNERGASAIFLSRFMSGFRLPIYLAAGFLRTNFPKFALYFFIAAAIWTPILVGFATFAQQLFSPQYVILSILALFILLRLVINLSTWRKRRLFVGRIKRIRHWEYWPLKVFYFPVLLYIVSLAFRYRSLTVFTCANPAILASGFIGESKNDIYEGLRNSKDASVYLLDHILISAGLVPSERITQALAFVDKHELSFPVVFKPDRGERGKDVAFLRSFAEMETRLVEMEEDYLLQEFAPGVEASIFYYRYPKRKHGKIFSITEKSFPSVVGDGQSTLEILILKDKRAVCLARRYFEQNKDRLDQIPRHGEEVQIVDIGTHSRGAVFKEGDLMKTPELEKVIDQICRGYKGFYFGRFDIRAASFEDLKNGKNFSIIELNGVTSESTNIYDKRYSLFNAYRILFSQWRIAFEIGEENRKCGVKPVSLLDLIRLLFRKNIRSENGDRESSVKTCA